MSGAAASFSSTYAQARERFLQAAKDAGLKVESHIHPEKGSEGEELAMDVVRDGPADAASLLILTSGCHGVEGFCGSGVQVAALRDAKWRAHARDRGVAVLYIHALNPYGFSHLRRVTHENVDLNRNFHDFTKPLPDNPGYREIHEMVLPPEWPPSPANSAATAQFIAERGLPALQAATSRGQHEFPGGMFFGGTQPTWSNLTLREVLRAHGRRAARIAWIDFHTGLGPLGVGERIFAGRDDPAAIARAHAWWDGGGKTRVTSIYDGSSTSAFLTGLMSASVYEECPQAESTMMALEYGVLPMMQTLGALRAEHWLHLHPEASPELAQQIKQDVRNAFYADTGEWKELVAEQAFDAMSQAAHGLAAV